MSNLTTLKDRSFGQYRFERLLASSSRAAVYQARDERLERTVAVKVSALPGAAERYRAEARLTGSLDHPNILPVYDFGEQEGIAYLVRAYGITATDPGQPGYQSVLSMLIMAVAGRGWFYYVTIGSVLAVLALSANTGFADFPRLCRVIALDGYLPNSFAHRGRRLVYSRGIIVLAVLSGALLIIFNGKTERLIPLFAIGAFLAFTMSQAGMVAHWRTEGGRHARTSMLINGAGAICTGVTLVVVLVSKFGDGAYIMVLLIPALLVVFVAIAIAVGASTLGQGLSGLFSKIGTTLANAGITLPPVP